MIDTIRRIFRPIGRTRQIEADQLSHATRNEIQATETERWLLQKERESHERTGHFWADVLSPGPTIGKDDSA